MIYSVTGHRPNKLGGYSDNVFSKLTRFAIWNLREVKPDEVITGMALGWDQAIAVACLELFIPFTATLPYPNYGENWPEQKQEFLKILVNNANKVIIVSDSKIYQHWLMQSRNEWMVDNSDVVLALWNGTDGGTKNCIKYAEKVNKPVVNFWDKWLEFEKE